MKENRDPFYGDRMDDPRLNSGRTASRGTQGFVDDLNGAIRENPVAAGLIGLGVAWFLFGNRGFGAAASAAQSGAESLGYAARSAGESLWSAGQRAGESAGRGWDRSARSMSRAANDMQDDFEETGASYAGAARGAMREAADTAARGMKSAGSAAQDALSRTTEQISGAASEMADYASSASQRAMRSSAEFAGTAQESLKDAFERQPLLLGAVGLAIGAGLASAFASTRMEEELLGDSSAAVRARAQQLAETAREKAGAVMSDVKSEAERQGLTPSAAKQAAGEMADKAKAVAGAAVEGVRGSRQ